MEKTLEGRTAIVTGAAQGIGRALALKLASRGANILACDLEEGGLNTLRQHIQEIGGNCQLFVDDITEPTFGDRVVEECLKEFEELHVVVNNAGYIWNSRITNHSDEQWYSMIDVHATAPFRILRAAGKYFRDSSEAGRKLPTRKVVNVSSISGIYGADTQFSYSAAKSALIGMSRSLAKDWGRYNVTVNCVAFGHIDTRLTQPFEENIPEIELAGRSYKVGVPTAGIEMAKNLTPLGRSGTPEDAAGAIYLFCLPESDFISGEIILASGGLRL